MKSLRQQIECKLGQFPSVSLGVFPTPLQQMNRYGDLIGHPQIFIKRDDMTGLGLGGNKTRTLEFLLGEAVEKGTTTILAAGALQSNLCSLTAAAAGRLGLECILIHNDDPPTAKQGNILLNALNGAQQKFLGTVSERKRDNHMKQVAKRLKDEGKHPYIIENSGSTPTGALGYTSAAAELARQNDQLNTSIKHIAIPGAMAGTASGLVAGSALLNRPFHVHVINVEYSGSTLNKLISKYTRGVFELLEMKPPIPINKVMTIHNHALGPGYAEPTTESMQALVELAQTEGVYLETIYTSKTLAGLKELIQKGVITPEKRCCFWHTGGVGALFGQSATIEKWLQRL